MNCVPCKAASTAGDVYGLMPGDLMTISNAASLLPSTAVSMLRLGSSIARMDSASPSEQKTVIGWRGRRQRSAARAARPSRP